MLTQNVIKGHKMYICTLDSGIIGLGRLLILEKNSTQDVLFQPPLLFKFETFSMHSFY